MSEPLPPLSPTFEAPARHTVFVVTERQTRPYWLHLLLLLLTMGTTLVVGAQLYDNFAHGWQAFTPGNELIPLFSPKWIWAHPSRLVLGIPFSATLMTILLAHEMGHFLMCERYRINATLPFFIPMPTLIGTMGAFIRIKSPIRSRKALFDIGVAGPIAGFLVAVPLLILGLALSHPLGPASGREAIYVGFPLIFEIVYKLIVGGNGHPIPLYYLALHPIAVAAWAGMFATAANLLPGGQLDGGHIIYALRPRWHRGITLFTVVVLALLSVFWIGWMVWAVLLAITGWRHPAVALWPGLDRRRLVLAVVTALILILTFTPAPIVEQGWLFHR